MKHVYPVILAGGVGERFWPCSRASRPKQMIPMTSSNTLFEETLSRAEKLAPARNIIIMTSQKLEKLISRSLKGKSCKVIGEPVGKNTAPAIAAAAAWVLKQDPNGIMIVLSSDHNITPVAKFVSNVKTAVKSASDGHVVVFGIPPVRPDVGYGYIQFGKKQGPAYKAERFCEKPDTATAKKFLKKGCYLWNSGMFVWKASVILSEFERQMPNVFRLAAELGKAYGTRKEKAGIARFYKKTESQSIDYGIMEHARNVTVVKTSFNWDDVGSWEALWRLRKNDADGNVTVGNTINVKNRNTLLFAEEGMIAGAGLDNMVVVQSNGAVLVIPRDHLDDIKKYIAMIRKNKKMNSFLN